MQVVKGSNFDMGYQQGMLNALLIKDWMNYIFSNPGIGSLRHLQKPLKILKPLIGKVSEIYLKKTLKNYLPDLLERLYGISEGAGCSIDEIFFMQSVEILGTIPLYQNGCSVFISDSSFFNSGEPVLCKNFDYLPFLEGLQILRKSCPDKGYRSLDITMTPLAGNHAGMNECGLTVLYNYSFVKDKQRRGVPLTLLIQHFLQTCSNVEQVLQKIEQIPWASSGILILGDDQDTFAIVELSNRHISKRRMDSPWAVITNHFIDPFMKQYEISQDSKFHTIFLPEPWKGVRIHETSEKRYNDLESFFQRKEKISLQDIKRIFADHGNSDGGTNNSVCRHSKISSTLSSSIFLPASRKLHYCNGAPCSEPFNTFDMEQNKQDN